MKRIFIPFLFLLFAGSAAAQYDWLSIYYYHSSGPVSPEYQYTYHIQISEDGQGKLEYTKSGKSNVYDFTVGKSGLRQLNSAIVKTGVLSTSKDSLDAGSGLIGGPVNSATITLPKYEGWKKNKNPIKIIPSNVKEEYLQNVMNLYLVMENLVPASVWSQAQGEW